MRYHWSVGIGEKMSQPKDESRRKQRVKRSMDKKMSLLMSLAAVEKERHEGLGHREQQKTAKRKRRKQRKE